MKDPGEIRRPSQNSDAGNPDPDPGTRAIIGNIAWLFSDKALRFLIGIVVGAWVARTLGPATLGELSYAIALVALFQNFAKLGLDAIVVRELALRTAASGQVLGTALCLQLGAGLGGSVLAMLTVAVLRPGDSDALLLVGVIAISLVLQAGDTVDLWFQSRTESRIPVIAKAAAFLLANCARIAALLSAAPLVAFAGVVALDAALAAAFLARAYRRRPAPERWAWSPALARRLLAESRYLLLAGVAVAIYMRIDQVMLRELAGMEALGLYAAILPLSEAWAFIPLAVVASLAPTLARVRTRNPVAYSVATQRLYAALALTALLIAACIATTADWIVATLFGPAYADAAPLLAVHVFTAVPVFLGTAQSVWIVNEGRSRIALGKALSGAAAAVILNATLIPAYGALGAAIASCIAYTVSAVIANAVLCPEVLRMQLRAFLPWTLIRVR